MPTTHQSRNIDEYTSFIIPTSAFAQSSRYAFQQQLENPDSSSRGNNLQLRSSADDAAADLEARMAAAATTVIRFNAKSGPVRR